MCTIPIPHSPNLDHDEGSPPRTFSFGRDLPSSDDCQRDPPASPIWNPAFRWSTSRPSVGRESDAGRGDVGPVNAARSLPALRHHFFGIPGLHDDVDSAIHSGSYGSRSQHRDGVEHLQAYADPQVHSASEQRFASRKAGAVTDPAHARPPRGSGSYFTPLSQGGFGINTAPAPSRVLVRPAVPVRTPSSTEPTLSCTLWEEERCVVVQVVVGGHVVARRTDNDWVNSTKLLNMVDGLSRGKRDMFLKNEPDRLVFRRGALHLKGVWLPLEAAARLAREHGLVERLYPLFEPAIVPYLLLPAHRPQTSQLVATARARRALLETGNDQAAGSGLEVQRDMQRRQRALDAVLQRLEEGLRGLPPTDCDRLTTATSRLQSEAGRRRRASSGPMFSHSADTMTLIDTVGGRQRPRSASVAISRRHAIRGSTSTTISSLGTMRARRNSDDASSTTSLSSSSSFSSLEFTPLESDMRTEDVVADSAGPRTARWSPVSRSYTLVLAPDAASTSSVSTLHSVPGSRSRTASGVASEAGHGPAATLEAEDRVLAAAAAAAEASDVGERPSKRCRAAE